MNPYTQTEIFFFISSIGFVLLWILLAIFLVYLIRAMSIFSRIMERMEQDIDKIGDTTKEMLLEMKDSAIFHFLFRKKKKGRKE
jgi:uncharacterized protein YoxC